VISSIEWNDGRGMIDPNLQYGYTINRLLKDIANDNSLEQFVQEPTHKNHTLELLFCTDPTTTTNIQIVPGISDHDAIFFQINLLSHLSSQQEPRYSVYLYHKANIGCLKQDIYNFQQQFLPYSTPLEDNCLNFRSAVTKSINKNITQKLSNSNKDLPWITRPIRMRQRKKLYDRAKHLQTAEAWSDYRKIRNKINNEIKNNLSYLKNISAVKKPRSRK